MERATLQVLIDQARSRSDAAQVRHAALLRAAEQARAQRRLLDQYTQEYEDRGRMRQGESRDPSATANYRAFQARLQQAADTQEREVQVRTRAAEAAAADVAQCLRKLKSLETLARRQAAQQERIEERRDQKHTDEFAQRAHAAGRSAGTRPSLQGALHDPDTQ